jgi:hypothetical protein
MIKPKNLCTLCGHSTLICDKCCELRQDLEGLAFRLVLVTYVLTVCCCGCRSHGAGAKPFEPTIFFLSYIYIYPPSSFPLMIASFMISPLACCLLQPSL